MLWAPSQRLPPGPGRDALPAGRGRQRPVERLAGEGYPQSLDTSPAPLSYFYLHVSLLSHVPRAVQCSTLVCSFPSVAMTWYHKLGGLTGNSLSHGFRGLKSGPGPLRVRGQGVPRLRPPAAGGSLACGSSTAVFTGVLPGCGSIPQFPLYKDAGRTGAETHATPSSRTSF